MPQSPSALLIDSQMTQQAETPAALGYRMPAEWEPHEATWIAWPHNSQDWPGKFQGIQWTYVDIVRHLSKHERLHILVNNEMAEAKAELSLDRSNVRLDNIQFHKWATDRVWTRDSGPIFVKRDHSTQQIAVLDWQFNAWAKYPNWQNDDALPGLVAAQLGMKIWKPAIEINGEKRRIVLEGGSIDVNGRGTMLTTEECLLSDVQQRNPGVNGDQLEQIFADFLNVKKAIWLQRGIAGDDTHGHIDDIARFVAPNKVVAAVESNHSDENYEPLRANLQQLKQSTDQDGRPLEVIELPMPAPVVFRNQRLPASYANFYIANDVVLVPTFNDPNDRHALNVLAELFPERQIIGIHCADFIWGLGAIHCMTQQQPK
ncbi:MAG TPA: agmatine deiminase family protein [Terriglobales bacterium]